MKFTRHTLPSCFRSYNYLCRCVCICINSDVHTYSHTFIRTYLRMCDMLYSFINIFQSPVPGHQHSRPPNRQMVPFRHSARCKRQLCVDTGCWRPEKYISFQVCFAGGCITWTKWVTYGSLALPICLLITSFLGFWIWLLDSMLILSQYGLASVS